MTTSERNVPSNWFGTEAEWVVFNTLTNMGRVQGRDFIFKGRQSDTGVAFQFISPPDLGINVLGLMQNYAEGTDNATRGFFSKQQLLGQGVRLIFIEDVDLAQDPNYYVEEALKYRDHSHMGG